MMAYRKYSYMKRTIGLIIMMTTLAFSGKISLSVLDSNIKFGKLNPQFNTYVEPQYFDDGMAHSWLNYQNHSDFVVSAYNQEQKVALNRKISKCILIVSIPAFIAGVGLTMGCGDTENPDRFCRQKSTQIGTNILGFGGMLGIVYGIYGLIHFRKE